MFLFNLLLATGKTGCLQLLIEIKFSIIILLNLFEDKYILGMKKTFILITLDNLNIMKIHSFFPLIESHKELTFDLI